MLIFYRSAVGIVVLTPLCELEHLLAGDLIPANWTA